MTFQIEDGTVWLGTKCPTTQFAIDPELRNYAIELIKKPLPKTMTLSNGKYSIHLEIDEDTYWGLIKLGAEIKTDWETYAENILLGHVQSELDKQTKD